MQVYDVIIVGAGAAGLMCARSAAKRGRKVLILDHANKLGKKILLSGGGRCNFTNRNTTSEAYLSHNAYFCISALKRFTQMDFEKLVVDHNIAYHEKTLGQLFCNHSSKEIVALLLSELQPLNVDIKLNTTITKIEKSSLFSLATSQGIFRCQSLVVATGGLSFPTMGASPFGYKIAEQFGLKVHPVRAGLVPLTLHKEDLEIFSTLSGISLPIVATSENGQSFREAMLFTHRGLSGPAILQISSYWQPGEAIMINLLPDIELATYLQQKQQQRPKAELKTILSELLPTRFVQVLCEHFLENKLLKQFNDKECRHIGNLLNNFSIKPNGTEGYRTAEVTLGGVDTDELSSKTFESKKVPGLYFIGEVLDVTGHLGGFNFQWAWSSGFCCGQYV